MRALCGEVRRFLAVGITSTAIDLVSYRALLWAAVGISPAKAAGFVAGSMFGYFAHRLWTFRAAEGGGQSVVGFTSLYAFSMAVNVTVNGEIFATLNPWWGARGAAFLVATATVAVLNFLGMKFVVFKGGTRARALPMGVPSARL